MSATFASAQGYKTAAKQLGTPRSIEYQVFARVTGLLKEASGPDGSFVDLAHAIHENTRLWTVIMCDVASDDNGLTDMLRAQIFYLGEFSLKHAREVLARSADAEALIEINTIIMRGLRQQAPGKGLESCQA